MRVDCYHLFQHCQTPFIADMYILPYNMERNRTQEVFEQHTVRQLVALARVDFF